MDILGSNHVLETDKLQNEISTLKKQLAQRDQALLEKDKQVRRLRGRPLTKATLVATRMICFQLQICTLKAEALDREKDFRQKLQSQQRTHQEQVEALQVCSHSWWV